VVGKSEEVTWCFAEGLGSGGAGATTTVWVRLAGILVRQYTEV
jgi:hypothetical protein